MVTAIVTRCHRRSRTVDRYIPHELPSKHCSASPNCQIKLKVSESQTDSDTKEWQCQKNGSVKKGVENSQHLRTQFDTRLIFFNMNKSPAAIQSPFVKTVTHVAFPKSNPVKKVFCPKFGSERTKVATIGTLLASIKVEAAKIQATRTNSPTEGEAMFPTKESNKTPDDTLNKSVEQTFASIDQFASWLDNDLEALVNKFTEFETDKSVRKFFTRS